VRLKVVKKTKGAAAMRAKARTAGRCVVTIGKVSAIMPGGCDRAATAERSARKLSVND
jgi:hypothetical protein